MLRLETHEFPGTTVFRQQTPSALCAISKSAQPASQWPLRQGPNQRCAHVQLRVPGGNQLDVRNKSRWKAALAMQLMGSCHIGCTARSAWSPRPRYGPDLAEHAQNTAGCTAMAHGADVAAECGNAWTIVAACGMCVPCMQAQRWEADNNAWPAPLIIRRQSFGGNLVPE